MPCYHPRQAFLAPELGLNGKQKVSFKYRDGWAEMALPCGQCMGCRIDRTSQWALRIKHETYEHKHSIFVTLTLDDDNLLEQEYSVHIRTAQAFVKGLRQYLSRLPDPVTIRFYLCAEYGEKSGRAHYHIIIFGWWPSDAKVFREGRYPLWRSEILEHLWGRGHVSFAPVTDANASYVAQYCQKKWTGKGAKKHYQFIDKDGVYYELTPEFALMSRRPGIGRAYVEKYASEILSSDSIVRAGREVSVPKYYYKVLAESHPAEMATVRAKRKETALLPAVRANSTKDRLRVREEVAARKRSLKSKGTL